MLGVPSTGTSGSLADAFTTTLQIDPDYYSSRIRVVNGTILNVKQVQQGPTNPVVFLVCGIMKHPLNEYVDFELYEGDNKLVSIGFGCPQAYLVQLTVVNGALDAFWICYTKSQSQTNECNRCSFDLYFSDILSLTTVYFLFEFTDTIDLLVGVPGTAQTNFVITNPTNNNICLIVALNLVGNLYTINGHSWGYHIYSSNQDLTNTEANGRSNVNIDTALNLYISANVNPYNPTINYVNEINENIGPIQINIYGELHIHIIVIQYDLCSLCCYRSFTFWRIRMYVDIFSTSSTGMSRVYQNIVTTTPAFYGYPLYPVFPILGTNSFFATYNNIGYFNYCVSWRFYFSYFKS